MNNWQLLILLERFAVLKDVHKPKESEPKINHSQSKLWLSLQAQAFGRSWVWVPTLPYTRCWSKLAFFFFFLKKLYLFIFGCTGSSLAVCGLSLVIVSRGCSLAAVRGLLIAVASLVAEHRLEVHGFQYLGCMGLVAPWHVGSSQTRNGTYVPTLHWQADSQPMNGQWSPKKLFKLHRLEFLTPAKWDKTTFWVIFNEIMTIKHLASKPVHKYSIHGAIITMNFLAADI